MNQVCKLLRFKISQTYKFILVIAFLTYVLYPTILSYDPIRNSLIFLVLTSGLLFHKEINKSIQHLPVNHTHIILSNYIFIFLIISLDALFNYPMHTSKTFFQISSYALFGYAAILPYTSRFNNLVASLFGLVTLFLSWIVLSLTYSVFPKSLYDLFQVLPQYEYFYTIVSGFGLIVFIISSIISIKINKKVDL